MDNKTKALLDRAVNLTAHLRWEAAECDRTNFGCQFRKTLEDTAALIEAQAAQIAEALEDCMASEAEREQGLEREKALREQLSAVMAERDAIKRSNDGLCASHDNLYKRLYAAMDERDAAVKDIHRCCDTCEWYRPSCGNIGAKRCSRRYEPSACMECVNWEWRGPQGAGEGGE